LPNSFGGREFYIGYNHTASAPFEIFYNNNTAKDQQILLLVIGHLFGVDYGFAGFYFRQTPRQRLSSRIIYNLGHGNGRDKDSIEYSNVYQSLLPRDIHSAYIRQKRGSQRRNLYCHLFFGLESFV
jgi:hypothetical protein